MLIRACCKTAWNLPRTGYAVHARNASRKCVHSIDRFRFETQTKGHPGTHLARSSPLISLRDRRACNTFFSEPPITVSAALAAAPCGPMRCAAQAGGAASRLGARGGGSRGVGGGDGLLRRSSISRSMFSVRSARFCDEIDPSFRCRSNTRRSDGKSVLLRPPRPPPPLPPRPEDAPPTHRRPSPPDMASGHAGARTLRRTRALLLGAGQMLGESAAGRGNAVFTAFGMKAAGWRLPFHAAGAPAAMDAATAPRPKELQDVGRSEAHETIMTAEIVQPLRMEVAAPGLCHLDAAYRACADTARVLAACPLEQEQRIRSPQARLLSGAEFTLSVFVDFWGHVK